MQEEDGSYNVDADPMSSLYIQLEAHNTLCCDLLSSLGFDGDALRAKAPVISAASEPGVTVPHTRDQQLDLLAAKTAGDHFFATGGAAINLDDYFIAKSLGEHTKQVEEMMTQKKQCIHLYGLEIDGCAAMETHNVQQMGFQVLHWLR